MQVEKIVYHEVEVVKIVEVEKMGQLIPWAAHPSVVSWNVSGRIPRKGRLASLQDRAENVSKVLADYHTQRQLFETERKAFEEARKVLYIRNPRGQGRV